ncbi:MAG: S8 family serine peptidase, partial [Caldilineaceae bacterium]|nr:S8 family serine peptidase [Caldilineaceae bacterium]
MANSKRGEKCEAVVVFGPLAPEEERPAVALRAHSAQRSAFIQARQKRQQTITAEALAKCQASQPDVIAISIGATALPVATVEVNQRSLLQLAEQPRVVAIMPNQPIFLIEPTQVTNDDLGKQESKKGMTWGLEQLEIPKVWERTQGAGVRVAVLDTGVFSQHEALAGRVTDYTLIDPLGRRIATTPHFDGGNHGTHVCGTIAGGKTAAGVSIGVAPAAELLVASVLVGSSTLRTLLEGIDWAVENGANIINMSLGFSYYEPLFAQVFDILMLQYDVLPVVAIGNENHGNSSSPGNAYNSLAAGAVERKPYRKTEVTFFSSGASLTYPGPGAPDLVVKPDVVAPGAQVYSCVPPTSATSQTSSYAYMAGTSMATPH